MWYLLHFLRSYRSDIDILTLRVSSKTLPQNKSVWWCLLVIRAYCLDLDICRFIRSSYQEIAAVPRKKDHAFIARHSIKLSPPVF